MNYEQMKLQPLPMPKGLSEVDQEVWRQLPDLWGDCASTRSRKKYQRARMRDQIISNAQSNTDTGAQPL